MRCKDCSEVHGYPYKRSHLVALRRTKISASDPPLYGGRESGDSHVSENYSRCDRANLLVEPEAEELLGTRPQKQLGNLSK
jgi:hypothetical protein